MEESLIKYYKDLTILKSDDFNTINKALTIAQKFIRNSNCILVGGQAIDFALRLKDDSIYENELLMDLDVISDTYFQYAYDLATILKRAGINNISVINALHPSTMKVRVNFKDTLDITYVPKNIMDNIPTLWYKGYRIIHPHYQMIDQHRALSYPYENAPRETILIRPEKDMERYDKLYKHYPLRILGPTSIIELKDITIPLYILDNQCISGFAALSYWITEAKSLGFQSTYLGSSSISNNEFKCRIPHDAFISIYSDDIKDLYERIKKLYQKSKIMNGYKILIINLLCTFIIT